MRLRMAITQGDHVETLWVEPVDGRYRVDGIPLTLYNLSLGDILVGEMLVWEKSGHRTIRVRDEGVLPFLVDNRLSHETRGELVAIDLPPDFDEGPLLLHFAERGARWEQADPQRERPDLIAPGSPAEKEQRQEVDQLWQWLQDFEEA